LPWQPSDIWKAKLNLLVFNCGSSSLNYKVFATAEEVHLRLLGSGKAHRVGVAGSQPSFIEHKWLGQNRSAETAIPDQRRAAQIILAHLKEIGVQIHAVGHRFVHGGSQFNRSVLLNETNLGRLRECLPLAPIHNPNTMSVIEECQHTLGIIDQYVCFDTAFHAGMPPESFRYALPDEVVSRFNLRRFGFHGLSYQYVTEEAATYLRLPLDSLKLIACHLGTGGSSVAAVLGGHSADTSMGFSPLSGLIMGTRTGDLDPLVPLYMIEMLGETEESLNDLFNKKSGLLGISALSSDLRDILKAAEQGSSQASLAFEMYSSRLRKTIGSYAALLGGFDALIFTDDIGINNPPVREAACQGLSWCGVILDPEANKQAPVDAISEISSTVSNVHVLSIPTDEEWVIGQEGARLLKGGQHADL